MALPCSNNAFIVFYFLFSTRYLSYLVTKLNVVAVDFKCSGRNQSMKVGDRKSNRSIDTNQ